MIPSLGKPTAVRSVGERPTVDPESRGRRVFNQVGKPLEKGDDALCRRYEEALSQAVILIPFDKDAARS